MLATARQALAPVASNNFRARFMASRSARRRLQNRKRQWGAGRARPRSGVQNKTLANHASD
eukprot:9782352-Lingulodinium_polyedra.AAC.1